VKHILGTEVGWLGGTNVNIEDNKFEDFHTCYLGFKAGSVTMFVILMIFKAHFEKKNQYFKDKSQKGRRITRLTPDHVSILTAK
jgi:hypothetical protein